MSITHEIYNSFDEGFEVCAVFLHISKAFAKVSDAGQQLFWKAATAGLAQGSVLGPLLFLIYTNELSEGFKSNPKLFADNTFLFSLVKDTNLSQIELNEDLAKINNWVYRWKMNFNPDPSKQAQEVIFRSKSRQNIYE